MATYHYLIELTKPDNMQEEFTKTLETLAENGFMVKIQNVETNVYSKYGIDETNKKTIYIAEYYGQLYPKFDIKKAAELNLVSGAILEYKD